jgi:hypothetical protein
MQNKRVVTLETIFVNVMSSNLLKNSQEIQLKVFVNILLAFPRMVPARGLVVVVLRCFVDFARHS